MTLHSRVSVPDFRVTKWTIALKGPCLFTASCQSTRLFPSSVLKNIWPISASSDAAEFFFAGPVMGAGGGNDVLFDHDAAHVVAAEAQTHLARLQTLRH